MALWTETEQENTFAITSTDQVDFDLDFNPWYGSILVFRNGILVSKSDYTVEGRKLHIDFPVEEGDYIICRLVV